MKKEITVSAPATVANVACGFDILGFAIAGPEDRVKAKRVSKKGVRIANFTGMKSGIPKAANVRAISVG